MNHDPNDQWVQRTRVNLKSERARKGEKEGGLNFLKIFKVHDRWALDWIIFNHLLQTLPNLLMDFLCTFTCLNFQSQVSPL